MPPAPPPFQPSVHSSGEQGPSTPRWGLGLLGDGAAAPGAMCEHWRQVWQTALEPTQTLIKRLSGGHVSAAAPRCVQQDKTLR